MCVSGQRGYLLHRRILPHDQLVERVAVRAYQLVIRFGKDQVADLTARVDCAERLQRKRVPKANVLVRSAAPRSQKTPLQRTPIDGLDCCVVLAKACQGFVWCTVTHRPQHQFVVIATRGQHSLIVGRPSQSTHLLSVPVESDYFTVGGSQILHLNRFVLAARGDQIVGPGARTDPQGMLFVLPHNLGLLGVPNLQLSICSAHSQMRSSLAPAYRGNFTSLILEKKITLVVRR